MSKESANKMWGGRFTSSPSEIMEQINASVAYDKRLAPQDIRGSIAHARMLADTGIISKSDVKTIVKGLEAVNREIADDRFVWSAALEDVHMNVENRLRETVGEAAGRLHTARSRNDQVATDFRLYIRDTIDGFDAALAELQLELARKADAHASVVMPGFTHLQPAQPVTFGHHLLAYVEMLGRDRSRFSDARRRLNECPLGAAALAGTSFPIDRKATAAALDFDRPTANSLDSVSDRDFVLETLSAASLCAMHLSRFAEEIVIWSTPQFGFIHLSDAWTTCRKNGIERVYFCSREGWSLMRVFEEMIPFMTPSGGAPEASYLYVSRLAVMQAACAHSGLSEFDVSVALLPGSSRDLRDVFRVFGLDVDALRAFLDRHGLSPDAPLVRAARAPCAASQRKLEDLLADDTFQEAVKRQAQPAQRALAGYLEQEGVFGHADVALVDIGWLGTIQHFLVESIRHRPDTPRFHGLLLGATRGVDYRDDDESRVRGLVHDGFRANLSRSLVDLHPHRLRPQRTDLRPDGRQDVRAAPRSRRADRRYAMKRSTSLLTLLFVVAPLTAFAESLDAGVEDAGDAGDAGSADAGVDAGTPDGGTDGGQTAERPTAGQTAERTRAATRAAATRS